MILVVLAIYVVVMLLVLGKDMLIKDKDEATIVIGDTSIWIYKEEGWTNITNPKTIESLSWQEYDVYLNNKLLGQNYLWNEDKWYIFDQNKKAIPRDGNLLAIKSNYDIKVKDFISKEIRNYYYVEKVLEQNELTTSENFTVAEETSLDIDNDGYDETIYFVGNAFSLDYTPSKVFALVFMVKNNNIYMIYQDIDTYTTYNGCKPYLSAVLDIDQDKQYELVISCGKYSTNKPVDMLYKLENEKFEILISNQ